MSSVPAKKDSRPAENQLPTETSACRRTQWRWHSAASTLLQRESEVEYHIPKLVFDPDSIVVFYWMGLVSAAIVYNAGIIALRLAFPEAKEEVVLLYIGYVDSLCDIIYCVDILVQLRTGYLQDGLPVYEPKKIRQQYASQSYFAMDLLSAVPYESFVSCLPDFIGIPEHFVFVNAARLTRLLKWHVLNRFYDMAECRTSRPHVIRVLRLSLCLAVVIHWIACLYYLLSEYEGLGSNAWVYTNDPLQQRFTRKYIVCMYWSAMTLTTIGNTNSPETDVEYIFTGVIFLTGVFVFATVLGNVGDVITSMNANRQEFQARMDHIKMYLTHKKVPASLQLKIKKWAEYSWSRTKATDESRLLNILPERLRAEVAVHVHLESLKKVKIFEKCETGFLCELVLKLRSQVFSPGDYICRAGETGREMFIINHGKVEVVVPNSSTGEDMVIAVLCEGNYFGEISLLRVDGIQNKRTADVRSIGYSELLCLSRRDLMAALVEYPEAKAALEAQAKMRMKTSLQAQRAYSVDALLRSSQSSTEGTNSNQPTSTNNNKEECRGCEVAEIKAMIEELKNINKVPGRTIWQLIARCEVLQSKVQEKERELRASRQKVQDLERLLTITRSDALSKSPRKMITKQFSLDEDRITGDEKFRNQFDEEKKPDCELMLLKNGMDKKKRGAEMNTRNVAGKIQMTLLKSEAAAGHCQQSNGHKVPAVSKGDRKKPLTFLDVKNTWKAVRHRKKHLDRQQSIEEKRSMFLKKSPTVLERASAEDLNACAVVTDTKESDDSRTESLQSVPKQRVAENIKNYLLMNARSLDASDMQLENVFFKSFTGKDAAFEEEGEEEEDEKDETGVKKSNCKRIPSRGEEEEEEHDDSRRQSEASSAVSEESLSRRSVSDSCSDSESNES